MSLLAGCKGQVVMFDEVWYNSKVTETWRHALVYLPLNYDAQTKVRYPVLYLQHGFGLLRQESASAWLGVGTNEPERMRVGLHRLMLHSPKPRFSMSATNHLGRTMSGRLGVAIARFLRKDYFNRWGQ